MIKFNQVLKSGWTDTHCHLSGESLCGQIDEIVSRAMDARVMRWVNICTDLDSLQKGIAAGEKFSGFFNAASTTPQDAKEEEDPFFRDVEKAAREGNLVAIGETGLDYYYGTETKEIQQRYLINYLNLAAKVKLPAIFHCRAAFDDLYAIADREFKGGRGLMHCFTGTKEDAKKAVDKGWLISLSGVVTFKKSEELREVVRYLPIEHIVLETDSPYLAPLPYRGKTNEPAYLVETGKLVAEIKGLSLEECARATTENARAFFCFANTL